MPTPTPHPTHTPDTPPLGLLTPGPWPLPRHHLQICAASQLCRLGGGRGGAARRRPLLGAGRAVPGKQGNTARASEHKYAGVGGGVGGWGGVGALQCWGGCAPWRAWRVCSQVAEVPPRRGKLPPASRHRQVPAALRPTALPTLSLNELGSHLADVRAFCADQGSTRGRPGAAALPQPKPGGAASIASGGVCG